MKSLKSFSKYLLAGTLVMSLTNACTNLDETLYDELPVSEYQELAKNLTPDQIKSAKKSAYLKLAGGLAGGHNDLWSANEVSSDEMLIAQRGGDWFDGGQWIRVHRHETLPTEACLNNGWKTLYSGIAICNRLIVQIPAAQPSLAATDVPELRALRALFYWFLVENFGNVPILTKFPGDLTEAASKSRAEVFAFIEKELNDVAPSLSKNADASTNGTMNYWAAKAVLARLYLNANVYKGSPEWGKCVTTCDEILNSGKYIIEPNYYANFDTLNERSKENILVVPYDANATTGFNIAQMTLHYQSQKTYKLADQPWNGYCSLSEFYDSYASNDKRKANFIEGQQYEYGTGLPLGEGGVNGTPSLIYTKNINEHFPNCDRTAGVRVGKYAFKTGTLNTIVNDYPFYRLGDVKLMKAEALWRQNAGDATALALVNEMRTRAGVAGLASLDAANLLAELGREKFAEGARRTDMVRFGTFTKPFQYKPANDPAGKALFPIPQPQLDANAQLKQNADY